METLTTTSQGEAIVRRALKHRVVAGTIEAHPATSTRELARRVEHGHTTQKHELPDVVEAVMLDALRYADSVGLRGMAHFYDEYCYVIDGMQGELLKTCTINFYFWTEDATKGGVS